MTQTLDLPQCKQCPMLEKVNKKMKEGIRSLKVQIQKLERDYHDLRISKKDTGIQGVSPNDLLAFMVAQQASANQMEQPGSRATTSEDDDAALECEGCMILREGSVMFIK